MLSPLASKPDGLESPPLRQTLKNYSATAKIQIPQKDSRAPSLKFSGRLAFWAAYFTLIR